MRFFCESGPNQPKRIQLLVEIKEEKAHVDVIVNTPIFHLQIKDKPEVELT